MKREYIDYIIQLITDDIESRENEAKVLRGEDAEDIMESIKFSEAALDAVMALTDAETPVPEDQKYTVRLHYGYESGECGVFHAFRTTDPKADLHNGELNAITAKLRADLDHEEDDEDHIFDSNFMDIELPDSVVQRIREDAVAAFLGKGETHASGKNDGCA